MPNITGTAAAGFQDASLWEQSKKKGDSVIRGMIDDAIKNTSVTVVCVTYGTANRKFTNYEIDESLKRGKDLVAVQLHDLKDQNGQTGSPGTIPSQIEANGFKAYRYTTPDSLAKWIEEAAIAAGR